MCDQNTTCPACNSENTPEESCMGGLGKLCWHRCRYCGMDYNHKIEADQAPEAPVDAADDGGDEGGSGEYEFDSVEECIEAGCHLDDCDDDGYCNHCGHQEGGDDDGDGEECASDEPWDGFRTDAEADADVLASAGHGMDEDYGCGGDGFFDE